MSGNAPKKADQGPSSSAAGGASAQPNSKGASNSNEVPHLGVLDEDDEFEEFEVQDWDDSETSLAHLSSNTTGGASGLSISGERNSAGGVGASGAPGSAAGGSSADHLWEDNWDDDDVEDDFSKALRAELDKQTSGTAPMAT